MLKRFGRPTDGFITYSKYNLQDIAASYFFLISKLCSYLKRNAWLASSLKVDTSTELGCGGVTPVRAISLITPCQGAMLLRYLNVS
jgi:hypothetical protein